MKDGALRLLFYMWNPIFPALEDFVEDTVISAMYVNWHLCWEADGCRCTGLFWGPLFYFGLRVDGGHLPAPYFFVVVIMTAWCDLKADNVMPKDILWIFVF